MNFFVMRTGIAGFEDFEPTTAGPQSTAGAAIDFRTAASGRVPFSGTLLLAVAAVLPVFPVAVGLATDFDVAFAILPVVVPGFAAGCTAGFRVPAWMPYLVTFGFSGDLPKLRGKLLLM